MLNYHCSLFCISTADFIGDASNSVTLEKKHGEKRQQKANADTNLECDQHICTWQQDFSICRFLDTIHYPVNLKKGPRIN